MGIATMKTKFNKLLIYRVTHIFVILILIVLTVLYVCPIKYVQVWEHPGEYYSVFQIINIEYYWILITSIILNILCAEMHIRHGHVHFRLVVIRICCIRLGPLHGEASPGH